MGWLTTQVVRLDVSKKRAETGPEAMDDYAVRRDRRSTLYFLIAKLTGRMGSLARSACWPTLMLQLSLPKPQRFSSFNFVRAGTNTSARLVHLLQAHFHHQIHHRH
jgi:hypothetical protein